jgi:hypothetical protein
MARSHLLHDAFLCCISHFGTEFRIIAPILCNKVFGTAEKILDAFEQVVESEVKRREEEAKEKNATEGGIRKEKTNESGDDRDERDESNQRRINNKDINNKSVSDSLANVGTSMIEALDPLRTFLEAILMADNGVAYGAKSHRRTSIAYVKNTKSRKTLNLNGESKLNEASDVHSTEQNVDLIHSAEKVKSADSTESTYIPVFKDGILQPYMQLAWRGSRKNAWQLLREMLDYVRGNPQVMMPA